MRALIPDPASHPTLYLSIAGLIIGFVLVQRVPWLRRLTSAAIWIIAGLLLIMLASQHLRFDPWFARIASRLHLDDQEVVGKEVRIRMAPDGHFWARVSFGGIQRRMLVDSGATVTAISTETAAAAGLAAQDDPIPVLINTANGTVSARSGSIPQLRLGDITARDLPIVISPAFGEMNVLGMNFLSKLKSWRVEGDTLILVPHHPVGTGNGTHEAAAGPV